MAPSYIAASTGHSVVLALLPALPLAGSGVGAGHMAMPRPVCDRRHGTSRTEGAICASNRSAPRRVAARRGKTASTCAGYWANGSRPSLRGCGARYVRLSLSSPAARRPTAYASHQGPATPARGARRDHRADPALSFAVPHGQRERLDLLFLLVIRLAPVLVSWHHMIHVICDAVPIHCLTSGRAFGDQMTSERRGRPSRYPV
jgi:hypothetical protein